MKKIKVIYDQEKCFLSKNCLKEWLPAILLHKKVFKVKKGELLFKEGDPVRGVFFVNSGNVKIHKHWGTDKELIIRFANDGSVFGHRGLGGEAVYPISATALELSIICYIDMNFFEATLKVNSEFTYKLLLFFAEELRESERKMRNLAHMSVKGRVAEALMILKRQFGVTHDGFLNVELSRQDLASYVGATYETVFRVINELVQDGLISLSNKSITITNDDDLLKLTHKAA